MIRSREEKVKDLIDKQTEELQAINQKVLACDCQADCSMHLFAMQQVELTRQLMDKLDEYLMQSIDAKIYVTDLGILMDGIEKFAEHKVKEKMYHLDVQRDKSNPRQVPTTLYKKIGDRNGANHRKERD